MKSNSSDGSDLIHVRAIKVDVAGSTSEHSSFVACNEAICSAQASRACNKIDVTVVFEDGHEAQISLGLDDTPDVLAKFCATRDSVVKQCEPGGLGSTEMFGAGYHAMKESYERLFTTYRFEFAGTDQGAVQSKARPSLGDSLDQVMSAFRKASDEYSGINIVEASIVGASARFRWMGSGKLGVAVGETGIRLATNAEYDELEESIELGQVQVYRTPLFVSGRRMTQTVLHQATGFPLDPNSCAARRQQERWRRSEIQRGI